MILRIIFDLIAVFVFLSGPWWLAIAFSLVGMFFFKNYLEIIFIGFAFDLVFKDSNQTFPIATVLSSILLIASIFIRSRMRI